LWGEGQSGVLDVGGKVGSLRRTHDTDFWGRDDDCWGLDGGWVDNIGHIDGVNINAAFFNGWWAIWGWAYLGAVDIGDDALGRADAAWLFDADVGVDIEGRIAGAASTVASRAGAVAGS